MKSRGLVQGAMALVATTGCVGSGAEGDAAAAGSGAPAFEVVAGQVPLFEPDPLFFSNLPNRWTTGQVGGLAVDPSDNIWVFHREATIPDGERGASLDPPIAECCIPAPAVLQFDSNGQFLQAWGGPGEGYEWFNNPHGIHVDEAYNVWLTGSSGPDNHILKFTRSGEFLLQIGRAGRNQGSNDRENVGGPADMWVHTPTNELFVADGYGNRRVIVFDAGTGAYKRHWGAFGDVPDDDYELPTRADLVESYARGAQGPESFGGPVHSVFVSNDALVYVADRSNLRLQVFNLDGSFVRQVLVKPHTLQTEGTVHEINASPDDAQTFLYVTDGSNKVIHVLDRRSLEFLYEVGGYAGHNAREFFHVHSTAVDSRNNLYLGEVNDGQRYYRWAFRGMGPVPPPRR